MAISNCLISPTLRLRSGQASENPIKFKIQATFLTSFTSLIVET